MDFSIDLIKALLSFSDKELKQIQKFITKLNSIRYNNKKFDVDKFYDLIVKMIAQQKILRKKSYYFDFSEYNLGLLEDMVKQNVLKSILEFSGSSYETGDFYRLLNHLINCYNEKMIMYENLNKLKDLKLTSIKFEYFGYFFSFKSFGLRVTEKGTKGKDYEISSFYTDGAKNWDKSNNVIEIELDNQKYIESYDNSYKVLVTGANYVMKYTKNENGLLSLSMSLSKLNFDSNTLPTYEELYSSNVWQELGDERTDAIDNVNYLLNSSNEIENMINEIQIRFKELSNSGYCKETFEQMKVLCQRLDNLSVIVRNDYKQEQIISETDFQKYIKPNQ